MVLGRLGPAWRAAAMRSDGCLALEGIACLMGWGDMITLRSLACASGGSTAIDRLQGPKALSISPALLFACRILPFTSLIGFL